MISPWPVTSANITERAIGLAEVIVAEKTPPLAVRIPNGTPPFASGAVAIHSVSGRPSPSTSMVCLVAAPEGIARPTDGHPAWGVLLPPEAADDDAAAAVLDPPAGVDVPPVALPPPPPDEQPARSSATAAAARGTARDRMPPPCPPRSGGATTGGRVVT